MRAGVEDVVFCYLRFPSGVVAHLHLSWLDPHKERRLTVVGSQRMATFDDMLLEGKLTRLRQGLRRGHALVGRVHRALGRRSSRRRSSNVEPLRLECEHFVECVRTGATPRSDGHSGLRVVRVLEQLQRSLDAEIGVRGDRRRRSGSDGAGRGASCPSTTVLSLQQAA